MFFLFHICHIPPSDLQYVSLDKARRLYDAHQRYLESWVEAIGGVMNSVSDKKSNRAGQTIYRAPAPPDWYQRRG